MKRSVMFIIATCLVMVLLNGCVSASEPETSQAEVTSQVEEKYNLEEEKQKLQSDYDTLKEEYDALKSDYEDLQSNYQRLIDTSKQSTLRNPTWAELKDFLEMDDTDTFPYNEDTFDCTGYAITLRDRVRELGFRCAFVEIAFQQKQGHALNGFQTTDKGLIFVDTTKNDAIAYVEVNKLYGVVHLDEVKFEYIACSGEPSEFWGQLTYNSNPNPFRYDYYNDYKRRVEFLYESIVEYNKAVEDYNRGGTTWSSSQLDTWLANLDALEKDLGSRILYELDVVENIQVYWN